MNDAMTPLAMAGSIAVWCGDQVTAGDGASDTAHRYSTLASGSLGLQEHNCAQSGAGWSTGVTLSTQLDTASEALDGDMVGYVMLMAGLNDPFDTIATLQKTVGDTIAKAVKLFPSAMIVVGCGPGCIPENANDDEVTERSYVLTAIRIAADETDATCIPNMRGICGSDPSLRADGISPNDAGHQLLDQAVEAAVREARGEPLDTPVVNLKRKYTSGIDDMFTRQIRSQRHREAEKREANRPTGTELTQLTRKLDELTRAQGLQQVILQQQQELLKSQQGMLERQQQQLESQQELLNGQQSSLEQVVAQQGSTVSSLQSLTQQLQSQQATLNTIQNQLLVTVGENFRRIFHRLNALDGLGE